MPRRKVTAHIDWDAQPLGKIQDTVLARQLKIRVIHVRKARKERDIPCAPPPSYELRPCNREAGERIDWDSVPFGTAPDKVLASELGRARATVTVERLRRQIPPFVLCKAHRWSRLWQHPLLGKAPDKVVAKRLRIPLDAVRAARARYGVSSAPRDWGTPQWWDRQALGQMPDPTLAKEIGATAYLVKREREARGIEAFESRAVTIAA